MPTLVIAEHDRGRIREGSLRALVAARALSPSDDDVRLLILGSELHEPARDAARFAPTIVADHAALQHPIASVYSRVIADVCQARQVDLVVAASTTFAKDILPRVAALIDAAMASDVTGCERHDGELLFQRPMFAGAVLATFALCGPRKVVTVRATGFERAACAEHPFSMEGWSVEDSHFSENVKYVGLESRASLRPDVSEAQVVVSGGRAFRTSEEFEQCVGRLADALGGATGCTRALVDAGIAPNEWQVGQTGKIVAPQLYFALGISGAVQHIAGMKGSKVIVAVNRDPDAPIFSIASYGIVGDVREFVGQLIEEIEKPRA